MGKDITVRVTGQNPDGTMTIQQVGGDGNPFAMTAPNQPSTAMTMAAPQQAGFPVRINGTVINFHSEADALKAQNLLRDFQQQQIPEIGNVGGRNAGSGGTGTWLRSASDAANAIGSYLSARGIRTKIDDARDAVQDESRGIAELETLMAGGKYADLIPSLLRVMRAERDATESHIDALGDQVTALDIATGAGVVKVATEMMNGTTTGLGNNGLALAGGAIGLGLLLNNNDDSGRRRRRGR